MGPKKTWLSLTSGGVETPENRWVIIFWRKKRCHNLGDTSHFLTHGYLKQNHRNWAASNQDLAGTPNPPCPLLPFGTPSASNTSLVCENRTKKCGTCASQGIVTGLESIHDENIHVYIYIIYIMSCPWTPGRTQPTTPLYTSNKPPTLTVTGHHFFPPHLAASSGLQLSPQGGDLCWCTDRWPGFILIELLPTLIQTQKLFDILLYQFKQLLVAREFFCFNPHDETVVKSDLKKYQNGQKKVKNQQNHRWYPLVN